MNDFDKLKNISRRNGEIYSCPIPHNVSKCNISGNDGNIVVDMSAELVRKLQSGEYVGALYITSKTEWNIECREWYLRGNKIAMQGFIESLQTAEDKRARDLPLKVGDRLTSSPMGGGIYYYEVTAVTKDRVDLQETGYDVPY